MRTNAEGHPHVASHSSYFEPESEALENIARVVTSDYDDVGRHRPSFPEIAGGLVAWFLRMPAVPVKLAGRHYRGPGFRILSNTCRLVDVGASETGNLVCEVLDEGERALLWFARHVGALPDIGAGIVFDEGAQFDEGPVPSPPETPETFQAPGGSETPGTPETAETPQTSGMSETSDMPSTPPADEERPATPEDPEDDDMA